MKIAVLAFTALPRMGGAEIFTYNLIAQLTERGHEVHLYLPLSSYREFSKLHILKNIKVHPILFRELAFANRLPIVLNLRLLWCQIVHKYDVWQVVGAHPAAHCTRIVSRFAPVAVRAFGADIQKDESINYGFRLNGKVEDHISKTLPKMSRLVALTPSIADNFREFNIANDRIVEISNGINLARFKGDVDRKSVRNILGVADDEILILTTGRYHIKKGYEYIPEAVKRLVDKGHKVKWLIVGKQLDAINHLINKYEVDSYLMLKGEIGVEGECEEEINVPSSGLINLYKSADLYVLPSLIEGMSNAMLEAMASGLPVITADAPGCRDLITHGFNGLLAEPKSSKSLFEQIDSYLCDEQLRSTMKKNIKNYIMNFDWKIIADKYEAMYRSLV